MLHLSKSSQKKISLVIQPEVFSKVQSGIGRILAVIMASALIGMCSAAFFIAPTHAPVFAFFLAYLCCAGCIWQVYNARNSFISSPAYYMGMYKQIVGVVVSALSLAVYFVGRGVLTVDQFNYAVIGLALVVPAPFGFWLFLYKRRIQALAAQVGLMSATSTGIQQIQRAQWLLIADDYLAAQPYEIAWFDAHDTLVTIEMPKDILVSISSYFSSKKIHADGCIIAGHSLAFYHGYVLVVTPSSELYKAYRIAVTGIAEENRLAAARGIKIILCTKLPFQIALYLAQRLQLATKPRQLLSSDALHHIELNEVEQTYEICSTMKVLFDCSDGSMKRLTEVLSSCSQSILLISNHGYDSLPAAVEQIAWVGSGAVHESALKTCIIAPRMRILFTALAIIERAHVDSHALLREHRTMTCVTVGFLSYSVCAVIDPLMQVASLALVSYVIHIVPYLRMASYMQRMSYHVSAGVADWVKPVWIVSLLYVIAMCTAPVGISISVMLYLLYGIWASSSVAIEQKNCL
jgi:hypothetical protein